MEIVSEIESKYAIKIESAKPLERFDAGNSNLLLKLEGPHGTYFYKELPSHSLESDLESIYSELGQIRPKTFKMVLPLKSKANNYCENIAGRVSSIYPFIEHKVLDRVDLPISRVFSCLEEYHNLIRTINLAPHPFKTYENWFERGPQQIKKRIQNHELLNVFDTFIQTRFKNLKFIYGNTHFDLNPFNIWVNQEDTIFFSDFDNSQPAALAKDYFDVSARYLRLDQEQLISDQNLKQIVSRADKYVVGFNNEDIKYLLVRPKLGNLFDPDNGMEKEQIKKELTLLLNFIRD